MMVNTELAFGSVAEAEAYARAEGIALGDNLERRGVGAVILDPTAIGEDTDAGLEAVTSVVTALKKSVTNLGGNLESVNTHFAAEITDIKKRLDAIEDGIKLLNKAAAAK